MAAMFQEQFLGKDYVMVSEENFDEYLKFTGVSYIKRKAAMTLKPVQRLTRNEDGTYTFTYRSKLANAEATFTPGVEFEEIRPDGYKARSTVTLEDNKMVHVQTEISGTTSRHVREFFPDKMIVTTTSEGFDKVVTRHFQLVQ